MRTQQQTHTVDIQSYVIHTHGTCFGDVSPYSGREDTRLCETNTSNVSPKVVRDFMCMDDLDDLDDL
jgi:hypothetical protein